jgi:hypothetical protein
VPAEAPSFSGEDVPSSVKLDGGQRYSKPRDSSSMTGPRGGSDQLRVRALTFWLSTHTGGCIELWRAGTASIPSQQWIHLFEGIFTTESRDGGQCLHNRLSPGPSDLFAAKRVRLPRVSRSHRCFSLAPGQRGLVPCTVFVIVQLARDQLALSLGGVVVHRGAQILRVAAPESRRSSRRTSAGEHSMGLPGGSADGETQLRACAA